MDYYHAMSKQYPKKGIGSLLSFVKLTKENINDSVKVMHIYYRNSEIGYTINLILILCFQTTYM